MPVYDYLCERCGPFTAMRPMAESDLPLACPACEAEAPRALLTAPRLGTMGAERRGPESDGARSRSGWSHAAGCGCCGGGGSRSFPAARSG